METPLVFQFYPYFQRRAYLLNMSSPLLADLLCAPDIFKPLISFQIDDEEENIYLVLVGHSDILIINVIGSIHPNYGLLLKRLISSGLLPTTVRDSPRLQNLFPNKGLKTVPWGSVSPDVDSFAAH
jgi:hypothetical protein